MICSMCKKEKLRREFPFQTITDRCDHPPLHCLRCVTSCVETSNQCSQCGAAVQMDNPCYLECCEILLEMFPEDAKLGATEPVVEEVNDADRTVAVIMLGGEKTILPYEPSMSIQSIKLQVKTKLGPPPEKQRLLYGQQELKTCHKARLATLEDYGVPPSSSLHLLVVLYEVPQSFNEVIFDLYWGYPTAGRDYLDASVLLYSGTSFVEVVDFRHRLARTGGVKHSGDRMKDAKCRGHHKIKVELKSIAKHVNRLFFTLSAWVSPNISKYKKPSLRFFDAREPTKQLCSDQMSHAAYSQAIIMCSLCKINESWEVLSLRELSQGNAKNYDQLKNTIGSIIAKTLSHCS